MKKLGDVCMKKVFISQKMSDKTEEQIIQERAPLVEKLENEGYMVIDSIIHDFDDNTSPILYLAKSIELLDQADIVIFMKGWETARGCIIEHETALKYHKCVLEL